MDSNIEEKIFATQAGPAWKKIGVKHHHGIALALSSLRSEQSSGIGEFFDLCPLIKWCKTLQMDIIQLLPLNDSGNDPSPYHLLSSCALHPIYLSLHKLPYLEIHPDLKEALNYFKKFNHTDRILYHEVLNEKIKWLENYIGKVKSFIVQDPLFQAFIKKNTWLPSYAIFKALSKRFYPTPWQEWPIQKGEEKLHVDPEETTFYSIVQFFCYLQLKDIKAYANQHSILILGDLPILVSQDSVDVWQHPTYFNCQLVAGVPPDYYEPRGQNWGLPLFNFDVMRNHHFDWYKQRLKVAEQFFDLFRIDHIVGFFRIFAILPEHSPKEGRFIPETEEEWEKLGKELLTMILSSTSMLPIGEDLGVVQPIIRKTMEELGICGTKILFWEKRGENEEEFIPVQEYPVLSLTSVSTHDSEPLGLWWKNNPQEAKKYAQFQQWVYEKELTENKRKTILCQSHYSSSLFHINLLQEYLALIEGFVRKDLKEERINIPGTVLKTNWTYRFLPSLEEITSHRGLFNAINEILKEKKT